MSGKLELVREEKLFRLLPGRRESSRLEASGVALVDDKTALVVFDNLNQVARIDLSLKRRASNRLMPAPSLGLGFEDIAIDFRRGRVFCLIEATADIAVRRAADVAIVAARPHPRLILRRDWDLKDASHVTLSSSTS